jgi:hypothetical protein
MYSRATKAPRTNAALDHFISFSSLCTRGKGHERVGGVQLALVLARWHADQYAH